jgi:uncharacterized membrane protein YbhN (UPF0104 family)
MKTVGSVAASMRDRIGTLVEWEPSGSTRRLILAIAGVVFITTTLVAVSNLPPARLEPSWLVTAGVLALFIPVANSLELVLAGRWVGATVGWQEAFSVTVVASAANLAPLPGAALVRAKTLLRKGAGSTGTSRVLAVIGVGWIAAAMWVASAAAAASGHGWLAGGALVVAVAGTAMLPVLLPEGCRSAKNVVLCLLLEAAAVSLQGVRLVLILQGLGYEGRLLQTMILPAAGALGNAAGVVPGGLGLREIIAGGLSPLVDLPATHGITAMAADRVLSLGVLAMMALGLVLLGLGRRPVDE